MEETQCSLPSSLVCNYPARMLVLCTSPIHADDFGGRGQGPAHGTGLLGNSAMLPVPYRCWTAEALGRAIPRQERRRFPGWPKVLQAGAVAAGL